MSKSPSHRKTHPISASEYENVELADDGSLINRATQAVFVKAMRAELSASHPPVEVVVPVKVTALAVPEPDGGFSVTVPEIPGLVTCCDSADEIVATVQEAASAYLAVLHGRNREVALADLLPPVESGSNQ